MSGTLDEGGRARRKVGSAPADPRQACSGHARDFRSDTEFLDGQLNKLALGPCGVGPGGLLSCDFLDYSLSSAFQPIFSVSDRMPHSHEALLRAQTTSQRAVSPVELFERASQARVERKLDRAARLLHVANFYAQRASGARLFLNVDGRHIEKKDVSHGEFFAAALAGLGLKADAITIEILESSIDDFEALMAAVASFKAFGFRIAIDDFGARHSNLDRVWRLEPDYVKIDRSLVVDAAANARARIVLRKVVEIVHELGALVICEGIETVDHEKTVLDCGTDFLQGYLYGRPSAAI